MKNDKNALFCVIPAILAYLAKISRENENFGKMAIFMPYSE
jgi:hypothetical protein